MADGADAAARGPGPARTDSGGWVPVPDPTTLTTEAVSRATDVFRRELQALRETLETRLAANDAERGRLWERLHQLPALYETSASHLRDELIQRDAQIREVLEQRLNDMDKVWSQAFEGYGTVTKAERDYVTSQIDLARGEIRLATSVSREKFTAVDAQFTSNAIAITAALTAQEKAATAQNISSSMAIAKSEVSTKETIAANATTAQTGLSSLEAQLADLKERVVRIESTGAGISGAKIEARASRGELNQAVVVAIMAVSLLVAIASVIMLVLKT